MEDVEPTTGTATTDNVRRPGGLSPRAIALLYVAFAAGWIVVSGNLLVIAVDDPDLQSRIEFGKGLLFVAVTGGLLYLLLDQLHTAGGAAASHGEPAAHPATPMRVRLFVLALVLVAPTVGYGIVRSFEPQAESGALADLEATVELKAKTIEDWLAERRADADGVAADAAFVSRFAEWQRTGAERQRLLVRDRLASLRKSEGYDSILVFDPRGATLMTVGETHGVTEGLKAKIEDALLQGRLRIDTRLSQTPDGAHIDLIFPLHADGSIQGVVLMRIDPGGYLFPILKNLPYKSETAEIVLARRDGPLVRFLPSRSAARDWMDSDMYPVVPTEDETETDGDVRTFAGTDFRGRAVLVALRPIEGTDWELIAKIDRDEVTTPIRHRAGWIAGATFLAVSVFGVLVLLLWRQQGRLHDMAMHAQSDRIFRNFYNLPFIGMAVATPDRRWVRFNDQICAMLGYARDELAQKTWTDITHPDDLADSEDHFGRFMRNEIDAFATDKRFIRKDGGVVHARLDVRCVRKADGTVDYFVTTLQDVTERVRAMEEILRGHARLTTTFLGTVDLAMRLGELRDPSTAGHERRCAEIAVAIGREMDLAEGRLNGIRTAAELHDVGNNMVPFEILNKPARLSAVEFAFVKNHPTAGFDILKSVDFPWPVAQVALQHHERWNGSGYPSGLKGTDIELEARIVGVADVVEAMVSHRPYRAAPGLEAALAEVESGRGTLYDPAVADACLRLFREKGYAVPAAA